MVIEDKDLLLKRIEAALNDIRPFLQVDGGNVEVVDVTDDMTVQIKWLGMCENCSMSAMTMKAGIEQAIKSRLPEIKSVVALNGMGLVV
jgi:Fe-S cluster biogenesis protein NfuA